MQLGSISPAFELRCRERKPHSFFGLSHATLSRTIIPRIRKLSRSGAFQPLFGAVWVGRSSATTCFLPQTFSHP